MFDKKSNEKKSKSYSKAISYEDDKEYIFKRSEKRAWTVAVILGVVTLLSWVAFVLVLPLKETIPYVIQVNEKTGIPDVVTVVDPVNVSANEALDKFFVNQYIQTRESYTYQTIQQTYIETQLYSDDNVKSAYLSFMNSPDSPDNIMKRGTISVKVNSIIIEDLKNVGVEVATARIVKTYTNEKNDVYSRNYIVKLAYEYEPKQKLKLSYRLENPLGFKVTSYQIIEENI